MMVSAMRRLYAEPVCRIRPATMGHCPMWDNRPPNCARDDGPPSRGLQPARTRVGQYGVRSERPAAQAKACGSLNFGCRGFTLVEMMVVIGILALLMAIVIPAANSLLTTSRANSTRSTMRLLASAIDSYSDENTLRTLPIALRQGRAAGPPIDGVLYGYRPLFGSFPPSPTVCFAPDPTHLDVYIWLPSKHWTEEDNFDPLWITETAETNAKFLRLIDIYLGSGSNIWQQMRAASTPPTAPEYASIECLVLFLSQHSTQARQIIDKLPDNIKTNLDRDVTFEDSNSNNIVDSGERVFDLFEIVDAWKRPMRYAMREPIYEAGNIDEPIFPAVWELRSAGPDGEFSRPWTDEDEANTDDVILRSQ